MKDSNIDVLREIESLSDRLREWQHQYYVESRPSVSDSRYDEIFDQLVQLEKDYPQYDFDDSPTKRVGSDLSHDFPEFVHSIPVLSLDKAYSVGELLTWCNRTKQKVGVDSFSFCMEEKIDGISIVLYYEKGRFVRAVTRGNGTIGNDVTANVKTIGAVPLKLDEQIDITVRGEIYLPIKDFLSINEKLEVPYANPRNLAAGTIRRIKSSETAAVPLQIFCYEGFFTSDLGISTQKEVIAKLKQLGFRVNPKWAWFSTTPKEGYEPLESLEEWVARRTAERKELPYEIDGLVFKVNEWNLREELGYTGHHPRWAMAYKFESPVGESVVNAIDIQVGRTGRITPVARINPVEISGSVVSNVTLHNQDYINMLGVAIGDSVSVSKRGDVIPAIEQVIEKGENGIAWKMPLVCPSCESLLKGEGAHLFCANRNCPDQKLGQILFFIARSQMDLDGVGEETAILLFKEKLARSIFELLTFDYNKLLDYPGFGAKKIALIQKGIELAKQRPYVQVLSSLGIKDLGPKSCELLINAGYHNIDALLKAVNEKGSSAFLDIRGIGPITAEGIVQSLANAENLAMIADLRKIGLKFEVSAEEIRPKASYWEGQIWCVTGSFETFKPRDLAATEVEKRGAAVTSAVSGKTTHLLAGEKAGSKLEKAQKLGITIVTESEFLVLLKENPIEN